MSRNSDYNMSVAVFGISAILIVAAYITAIFAVGYAMYALFAFAAGILALAVACGLNPHNESRKDY